MNAPPATGWSRSSWDRDRTRPGCERQRHSRQRLGRHREGAIPRTPRIVRPRPCWRKSCSASSPVTASRSTKWRSDPETSRSGRRRPCAARPEPFLQRPCGNQAERRPTADLGGRSDLLSPPHPNQRRICRGRIHPCAVVVPIRWPPTRSGPVISLDITGLGGRFCCE